MIIMTEMEVCNVEELNASFSQASSRVREISSRLSEQQLLDFYAYYKQAVEGPCTRPKPAWYQMTERQKWQAWSSLKDMDSRDAMKKYIQLLSGLDENWETSQGGDRSGSWIHHSTLKNTDEEVEDSNKTALDWIKEGNLTQFRLSLSNSVDVNELDDSGLSLLHWAADRGSEDIVRELVVNCKVDINIRDSEGQTALHYASSCGHKEVLKLLLDLGADPFVRDSDNQTPSDVACSVEIVNIFEPYQGVANVNA